MVSFLLALATAKRMGELQAHWYCEASRCPDISLACLLAFVAKMESEQNPPPRSFLVRSLEKFVGDLPEERLLCPVYAVPIYLSLTLTLLTHPGGPHAHSRRTPCPSFSTR